MTDDSNYPPKSKVNLSKKAKRKRKAWRPGEEPVDPPPPESGR